MVAGCGTVVTTTGVNVITGVTVTTAVTEGTSVAVSTVVGTSVGASAITSMEITAGFPG